jgi:cellulose synthase/poly-beta-1,6-N-acetylglucosamine synthase-like glycosyltransferase
MLISGAFGIMRRSVALEVGGYSLGTVGEDLELIVKIHRYMRDRNQEYEIRFIPDPVCWTEAPESLNILSRQRRRWQRGALETFFKHKDMLFNPRYGIAGMLGFPHILLVDVLAPPIEAIGYFLMPIFWATGALSWEFFAAYLALTFAFGVFISVGTLVLEEMELKRFPTPSDLMILTLAAVAENFGYRQINNLWRIRGWWEYLRGSQSWGEMTRKGFHKGV